MKISYLVDAFRIVRSSCETECVENSGESRKSAEGARRKLNLSGKRTEPIKNNV